MRERVLALRLPQEKMPPQRQASGGRWIVLAVVIAVLGFGYYFFYSPAGGPPATASTVAPAATKTVDSSTELKQSATASSGDIALDSKGYIIPVQRILVSPKISGMIVRLHVLEGRHVKKGDVLAEIEDIDYQADVGHAKFALESARQKLAEIETSMPKEVAMSQAELQEGQATYAQLKADFDRSVQLYKTKAIAKSDYDLAESKYLANVQHIRSLEQSLSMTISSREKRMAAAKAEVQADEADLRKAEWRLDNCTIRAPITGTILKKNAEEGNIVNPIAMNGSYSLCDLADLSDMEVEINVQERDVSKVSVGQTCRVRAEAFSDRLYHGVVSRLMPIADRSKGSIPVRVKIDIPREEEGVYLKPEMSALVSFLAAPPKKP
jgi:multidrug resistance efflux pump